MADMPVAQVIELSFLGALLERHPHSLPAQSTSKRSAIVKDVLQLLLKIVPIDSIFSCIATMSSDQDACKLCQTLQLAELKPPLSLSFFINAGLAIMKLSGDTTDSQDPTVIEDLFYVIFIAAKRLSLPFLFLWKEAEPDCRYLKWFDPSDSDNDSIRYLKSIVKDAIKDSDNKEIPAVSKDSIGTLIAARKHDDCGDNSSVLTIKSPENILSDSQRELQNLQSRIRGELSGQLSTDPELQAESSTAIAINAMLLDCVQKIRTGDLHTCIQIITAFMEDQIHIPISNFQHSVSIWNLWKLGLIFRKKVSNEFIRQSISESSYIQYVTDLTDHTASSAAAKFSAAANTTKYAGKLHFLLLASSHQSELPPVVSEHLTLSSLEDSLSTRFAQASISIDKSTLEQIEEKWDTLFGDVGMSTVVHTHRRLVASWLKFSLLIRKLRENLSCHTTVSIIGLVNSGKSTLVKELFRIKVCFMSRIISYFNTIITTCYCRTLK
jgi:hypothetical protein